MIGIIIKCKQKINRYVKTRKSELMFFRIDTALCKTSQQNIVDSFIDVYDYRTLEILSVRYGNSLSNLLTADCRGRFEKGSVLSIAVKNGDMVSYGWLAQSSEFWIAEIDVLVDLKDSNVGVLYDFYTKEAYRGYGIYPTVIQHLNEISKKTMNIISIFIVFYYLLSLVFFIYTDICK